MIRIFIFSFILLFAILLEATVTQIPLTLVLLIVFSVLEKRGWLLLLGFVAGFILDSLTFRLLGSSSLFFVIALGVPFLYGKKFETHHVGFGAFFIALSSLVYCFIFGNPQPLLATVCTVVIGLGTIFCIQLFDARRIQKQTFLVN